MKIILTDCDGVLFDFNTPFYKYVEARGHKVVNRSSYNLARAFGISEDEALDLCRAFSIPKNMSNLPWRDGAVEMLQTLHRRGFVFHFITSIDDSNRAARISQIRRVLPADGILDITCLGLCEPKYDYLEDVYTDTNLLWLEDAVSNYEDGLALGLDSYLIDQPYNRHFEVEPGNKRLYNLKDIIEIAERKYT